MHKALGDSKKKKKIKTESLVQAEFVTSMPILAIDETQNEIKEES